ncbi:NAD-dependent epimerase/dehydratase family protein [Ruegeria lacuscaerulensis]|uniref:NAD-dependent epimerase/dehydratase family protein n=1 Tax=Ruegeria lacuscaerulensis TaxID=55218 RepID=UPI00147EEAD4|nr:NAD(P)-dependent oxidoreductase [Ruegeria lacuscaerulensis]
MDCLVGYTGFVGGNLTRQHSFSGLFNSSNIDQVAGHDCDTLVVSAVPATMWLANQNPDADRANILGLFEKLRQVRADHVVLISTIAVYRDPSRPVTEDSGDFETELAYGRHRREFETLIADRFPSHLVLRLPALFGHNLKKNFLFDCMNPVPSFLKSEKYDGLYAAASSADKQVIKRGFSWDEGARMWRCNRDEIAGTDTSVRLRDICEDAGVTALAFTHADSMFQFYGLSRLWDDITTARENDLSVLNLATRPLRAGDIYENLTGNAFPYREASKVSQDMRSRYANLWGREDGYLLGRDAILSGIRTLTGLGQ